MSTEEKTLRGLIAHCQLTIEQSKARLTMLQQEEGKGVSTPAPARRRGATNEAKARALGRRAAHYTSQ